jgi:hypothetical protein
MDRNNVSFCNHEPWKACILSMPLKTEIIKLWASSCQTLHQLPPNPFGPGVCLPLALDKGTADIDAGIRGCSARLLLQHP